MMAGRSRRKPLFCLLMVLLLWFPWTPSAWGDDRGPARVLVIHSYHKGFAWTDNIARGMDAVLTHSGLEPEIYVEYMDTKRFPPEASFAYLEEMFRRKYQRIAFDVILLSDNNALTFALSRRDALFPDVPIVFCGVNNFYMALLDGQPAITGVAEEIDVAGTISLALRILPGIKQFVVVNDRTPTGRENLKKFQEAAAEFSDRSVSFEVLDNLTAAELQSRLSGLPADAAALVFTFHRTRDGQWLSMAEYLRLIRESCPVPIFSFWSHYLGHYVVGGVMVDGEAQGKICAEYAVRILKGESADAIPVLVKSPNIPMLDHRQLQRFSIPESRLPEGGVVAFAPTGFLHRYRSTIAWAISFVVALMAFTIVLLVNMARRRRMEKALRQSEEKFQKAFHSCPAFMSISTLDEGRFVEVNAECLKLIGSSREDVIGRKAVDVGLWDKTAREPILTELKQKGHSHHKEIEIRSKTGEEYHLLWFGDVVAIGGRECLVVTGYDQTDRKRAEEELLRYRRIVSASPDAMAYIDQDYRYRIINDAYERFSDTKREAFLGKTVPEYLGEDIFREKIKPHFDRCLEGETIQYEDWFEYPTLGRRYVQVTYFPFRDSDNEVSGIVANTRDLTELKRAEERLQASLIDLELAQRIAHIGNWTLDPAVGVPVWSDEVYRIYKRDPALGPPAVADYQKMYPPDQYAIFHGAIQSAIREGKPYDIQLNLTLPGGNNKWVHAICKPDPTPAPAGHFLRGTIQDITDAKKAEEKLQAYSYRLEEMVDARTKALEDAQAELLVKERLAVLGHFAGSISHEIRNPLAAIDSSVYLLKLKMEGADKSVLDHLDRITSNVRKGAAIIESLLNLSRMEKPRTAETDLMALVSETLRSANVPKTVEARIDAPDEPLWVDVDAEQIRMALKNIINNAVQAIEGSGTLTIAARPSDAGGVELSVTDTGPGIAPGHIEKVFEPLFSTKTHGIGFGLSITRMIVENHGGTIHAESPPDGGARFVITLPQSQTCEVLKTSQVS